MKKTDLNYVPDTVNTTPDYYCTWQTQLYATCDGKPEGQRRIISEKGLFDNEKPYGWAYFYEKARRDLYLVMDDSWDVPLNGDSSYYGSLILNGEKFPEAVSGTKSNAEALKNLTDRVKKIGWKGLGGWVCAQESNRCGEFGSAEEYWTEKIKEAEKSGFAYWKVDWGSKAGNCEYRKMLTEKAAEIAPELTVEHALIPEIIPDADVFRTYDVPAIMSIPMTMEKLCDIFAMNLQDGSGAGIVNCEDEVYIAAAGGFSMGIMRHPYTGAFTDGNADMSFPDIHRNLKSKMFEIVRAVRWHRIAPTFGVCEGDVAVDDTLLTDTWEFADKNSEIEAWWFGNKLIADSMDGDTVIKSAPAQIARNCAPAEVLPDENGNVPYIISAKNPNGAFSVATLGRTLGRIYEIPKCRVSVDSGNADIIAIFGEYKSITIKTDFDEIKTVYMQDLAGDTAYDIGDEITEENGKITISGEIIKKIGTEAQPADDTSEPGVLIKII